ncbi:hypothetical protein [Collimonas humicola]|uniref:hypothetical protein n=1 Tax=Collimonas humicola TaxID=2825886 RepID=UPI001B8C6D76|nr:hypothetical protein [Collimonas humicola]
MTMSKIDANLVRMLVENGRAKDIADLLEGESKFHSNSSKNIPKSEDELTFCRMALDHILFVAKFGTEIKKAKDGSHFYAAYPDYFEKWLAAGCLGIDAQDLASYLVSKPFK